MKQLCWLLCSCLLLIVACRKKREVAPIVTGAPEAPAVGQTDAPTASPAPAPTLPPNAPPEAVASIPAQHFSALSQALLTFRRDKKRAPRDWQELITTGYLKQMPAAPTGKRYTFNPTSLDVRMVNQ